MNARQSTARTFLIGPVLDADGVAVTSLDATAFKVSKNGGAAAALNGSSTAAHSHTGHYLVASAAGDFDTVGTAQFSCDSTTNACAPVGFDVIETAVYDALFADSATGALPVSGTVTVGTNNDKTGYALATTPPTATQIVDEWETQSQADPTGFHVNVKEVNGTPQTAGDLAANDATLLLRSADVTVWIDPINGSPTGDGTPGDPVSTAAAAAAIGNVWKMVPGFAAIGGPGSFDMGTIDFSSAGLNISLVFDFNGWRVSCTNVTWGDGHVLFSSITGARLISSASIAMKAAPHLENILVDCDILSFEYAYCKGVSFWCDISMLSQGTTPLETDFYECTFGVGGTQVTTTLDTTNAYAGGAISGNGHLFKLVGCYGQLKIAGLKEGAATRQQIVEYMGWGQVTLLSSCTGGRLRYMSHVPVVDQSGNVDLELWSEPGSVSGFTTAGKLEIGQSVWNHLTASINTAGSIGKRILDLFTGMTSLPSWLKRAFRKDAGDAGMATAETEINTGGTSTFVGTTDNLQAIKDASGGGGGGGSLEGNWRFETDRGTKDVNITSLD